MMFSFTKKKSLLPLDPYPFPLLEEFQGYIEKKFRENDIEVPKKLVQDIKRAFSTRTPLIKLKLENQRVSDEQLMLLIDGLLHYPLFSRLDLRDNAITEEGGKALCECFRIQLCHSKGYNENENMLVAMKTPFLYLHEARISGNKISLDTTEELGKISAFLREENDKRYLQSLIRGSKDIGKDDVIKLACSLLGGMKSPKRDIVHVLRQSSTVFEDLDMNKFEEEIHKASPGENMSLKGDTWKELAQKRYFNLIKNETIENSAQDITQCNACENIESSHEDPLPAPPEADQCISMVQQEVVTVVDSEQGLDNNIEKISEANIEMEEDQNGDEIEDRQEENVTDTDIPVSLTDVTPEPLCDIQNDGAPNDLVDISLVSGADTVLTENMVSTIITSEESEECNFVETINVDGRNLFVANLSKKLASDPSSIAKILQPHIDSLTALFLYGARITQLPVITENLLSRLKILDISRNGLETVDSIFLSKLPSLEVIDLSQNKLREIPDFHANILLKAINLSDNQIRTIENLEGLSSLEMLSISRNRISSVISFRSLSLNSRLAFVWVDGNPITTKTSIRPFLMNLLPKLSHAIPEEVKLRDEAGKLSNINLQKDKWVNIAAHSVGVFSSNLRTKEKKTKMSPSEQRSKDECRSRPRHVPTTKKETKKRKLPLKRTLPLKLQQKIDRLSTPKRVAKEKEKSDKVKEKKISAKRTPKHSFRAVARVLMISNRFSKPTKASRIWEQEGHEKKKNVEYHLSLDMRNRKSSAGLPEASPSHNSKSPIQRSHSSALITPLNVHKSISSRRQSDIGSLTKRNSTSESSLSGRVDDTSSASNLLSELRLNELTCELNDASSTVKEALQSLYTMLSKGATKEAVSSYIHKINDLGLFLIGLDDAPEESMRETSEKEAEVSFCKNLFSDIMRKIAEPESTVNDILLLFKQSSNDFSSIIWDSKIAPEEGSISGEEKRKEEICVQGQSAQSSPKRKSESPKSKSESPKAESSCPTEGDVQTWERFWDASSEHYYWYDRKLNVSSWIQPEGWTAPDEESEEEEEVADSCVSDDNEEANEDSVDDQEESNEEPVNNDGGHQSDDESADVHHEDSLQEQVNDKKMTANTIARRSSSPTSLRTLFGLGQKEKSDNATSHTHSFKDIITKNEHEIIEAADKTPERRQSLSSRVWNSIHRTSASPEKADELPLDERIALVLDSQTGETTN